MVHTAIQLSKRNVTLRYEEDPNIICQNHDLYGNKSGCLVELWLIIDDGTSVKSVVTIIDGSEFDETYIW